MEVDKVVFLKDLKDLDDVVYRTGRAGALDVNWTPWRRGRLSIMKKNGEIILLTLKDENWASHTYTDFSESSWGVVGVCGDYYLELSGVHLSK